MLDMNRILFNTASVHDVHFYLFCILKTDKLLRYTKVQFSLTQFFYIQKKPVAIFLFFFHFSPICHILYSVWIVSTCLLKSRCLLFLCLFYTSDQYVSIDALKYDIDGNYLQQYLQRFQ